MKVDRTSARDIIIDASVHIDRHGDPFQPSGLADPEFPQRLRWAVDALIKHLRNLNERLDWSEGRFVELEAEVEEASDTGIKRRAYSLVAALRKTHQREIVLVLGEPGSGKSVAMRSLTAKLLTAARKGSVLPIYLNMREWNCPDQWSADALPEPSSVFDHLWEWSKAQLHQRVGGTSGGFVQTYAELMRQAGHIFFILDSFDETRALLDLPKENELVARVADGIRLLLTGDSGACGVIASRYDRSPARWLNSDRWFELLPLTQSRIVRLIHNQFLGDDAAWRSVRSQAPFADLPRNPFEVFLIAEHLQYNRDDDNRPVFPKNRAEAYQSCIARRLEKIREDLGGGASLEADLHEPPLRRFAEALYTGRATLEIAWRDLPPSLKASLPDRLIDALAERRILRVGDGADRQLSFVHSRFGEYFAARVLVLRPDLVAPEEIPSVGSWRDVLVVYCEIAPEDRAFAIANYCFDEVQTWLNSDTAAAFRHREVRCLRFLDEAFRYRRKLIAPFAEELGNLLFTQVTRGDDPLSVKLALEATGLVRRDQVTAILTAAMEHPNPRIRDTALLACRYLSAADERLFTDIRNWLALAAPVELAFDTKWQISSLLSRNAALKPLMRDYWIRILDSLFWLLGLLLAAGTLARALGVTRWLLAGCLALILAWSGDAFVSRRASGPVHSYWTVTATIRCILCAALWVPGLITYYGGDPELWRKAEGYVLFLFAAGVIALPWFAIFRSMPEILHRLRNPSWFGKRPILSWLFSSISSLWAGSVRFLIYCARITLVVAFLGAVGLGIDALSQSHSPVLRICGLALDRVAHVIDLVMREFPWIFGIIAGVLALLWSCMAAWFAVNRFRRDQTRLKNTVWPRGATNRAWIQRHWDALELPSSRNRLVDRLLHLREVDGEWTGKPPYRGSDRASVRLMELDERWLGLQK